MVHFVKEKEESKKKIILSVVVCVITLIAGVALIMTSSLFEMAAWTRILFIALGIIVIAGGIFVAGVLDMSAGTFECSKCGSKFVPTSAAYLAGPHTITKRYLKCPKCGEKSYCKRRLTH